MTHKINILCILRTYIIVCRSLLNRSNDRGGERANRKDVRKDQSDSQVLK